MGDPPRCTNRYCKASLDPALVAAEPEETTHPACDPTMAELRLASRKPSPKENQ